MDILIMGSILLIATVIYYVIFYIYFRKEKNKSFVLLLSFLNAFMISSLFLLLNANILYIFIVNIIGPLIAISIYLLYKHIFNIRNLIKYSFTIPIINITVYTLFVLFVLAVIKATAPSPSLGEYGPNLGHFLFILFGVFVIGILVIPLIYKYTYKKWLKNDLVSTTVIS